MSEQARQEHELLLRKLDALMRQGKGNTQEANELRSEMEQSWYAMTEEEQEAMDRLSGDLYDEWETESLASSAEQESREIEAKHEALYRKHREARRRVRE